MRTITIFCLVALLSGCSSGSDDPPIASVATQIAELQGCLADGLDDIIGTLGGFETLLAIASDPASAVRLGVTWTPISPTEYDFTIPIDLDGDGTDDGSFDGTAIFSDTPTDGIALGDTVDVFWTLIGNPNLTGTADLLLTFDATHLALSGTLAFSDPSGDCAFTMTADAATPLELVIAGAWPPAPAFEIPQSRISVGGDFEIVVILNGNKLETIVVFLNDEDMIEFRDATVEIEGETQSVDIEPIEGENGGGGEGIGPITNECPDFESRGNFELIPADYRGTFYLATQINVVEGNQRTSSFTYHVYTVTLGQGNELDVTRREIPSGTTESFTAAVGGPGNTENPRSDVARYEFTAEDGLREEGRLFLNCDARLGYGLRVIAERFGNQGFAEKGVLAQGFRCQPDLDVTAFNESWMVEYACFQSSGVPGGSIIGFESFDVRTVQAGAIRVLIDAVDATLEQEFVVDIDVQEVGAANIGLFEIVVEGSGNYIERGFLGVYVDPSGQPRLRKVGFVFPGGNTQIGVSTCTANSYREGEVDPQ
ncbi:MAG: hypothetical protein AAGD14_13705 [Planctomycetota bacterium]